MAKLIRPIVPIKQWLEDEWYLGEEVHYIRPYVKEKLIEYFTGKNRDFIFTGASRTGKSYGARILVIRILYEISCYEKFPTMFSLSPSTLPIIIWFSFTKGKASSTGIDGLIRIIDKIPYFQDPSIKRKDLSTEIVFPFAKVVSGSNVTHAIGEDLLGAIIDEANIRRVIKGTEVEEAQKMFIEIRQRSAMTYSYKGLWGGFSGIISSSGTTTSFTSQRLQAAKENKDTVIMEASVYQANPEQYSKETFDVFVGNGALPPFIVDRADEEIKVTIATSYGQTLEQFLDDNANFIEKVPRSIRKFYEEDLSFSLMNMSGITQSGTNKFITNNSWIKNMWAPDQTSIIHNIPEIGIYDSFDVTTLPNWQKVWDYYHGENVYIHLDPSQKWDCTGFSALFFDREAHKIRSLLTCSFTINHRKTENQIDQEKLLLILIALKNAGANIRFVSGDHYAKDYLIPQCKKMLNNQAEYFSVDISDTPYLTLLNCMKKKMLAIPYYQRLEYELENLLYDRYTGTIDHPHNTDSMHPVFFKDCSDALAAACHHLITLEVNRLEEEQADKEAKANPIESDGFYETISLEEGTQEKFDFIEDLEESLLLD